MALEKETLLNLYRNIVLIRTFEERVGEMYYEDKLPAFDIAAGPIPGEMHLYSGQEAVAAGVCAHLRSTGPPSEEPMTARCSGPFLVLYMDSIVGSSLCLRNSA